MCGNEDNLNNLGDECLCGKSKTHCYKGQSCNMMSGACSWPKLPKCGGNKKNLKFDCRCGKAKCFKGADCNQGRCQTGTPAEMLRAESALASLIEATQGLGST